jgi:site-specific DNA-methyltransferase (adenine-specific)/adenine-specific DNA-methyltransferase
MPTLNWIGKQAVVEHHKQVPFHLLRCNAVRSVNSDPKGLGAGNLLVQGDNLLALKALLPYYAGQVKCIYIDPPYNTGNENWVYNDAVNSPEMRAWLGKVVGGEAEDLSRHDKWLCMMYPRLVLLRELLREDGSLWMSIDDNEIHHARAILDEIFGGQNFVATVIWQKMFSPKSSAKHLSANHDFILVYAQNADSWPRNLLLRSEAQDKRYSNSDNDPRGLWASSDLSARNYYSLGTYAVTCPSGRIIAGPPKGTYWRVSKEKFEELDRDRRIWWGKKGDNVPRLKRFLSEVKEGVVPQTIWFHQEAGNTQEAKKEVVKLLPDAAEVFSTPKPTRLIQRILQIATNPGDLVLDSFAGSGTTGHAVLQLNREDGGRRCFILVEMEPEIARNITAERLRRVIEGYTWRDQKGNERHEPGLGGGFSYCELGPTLFDPAGRIREEVTYPDLAQHVFFVETGQPLELPPWPPSLAGKGEREIGPLLGVANGVAVYLLYNGVLRDKTPQGGNVLTYTVLAALSPHEGPKVVYGTGCRIGPERLRQLGITFRQIPYEVKLS